MSILVFDYLSIHPLIYTFGLQELNIPEKDVEQLLVSLILDNRVHGHIDQVNQLLELGDRYFTSALPVLVTLLGTPFC